MSTKFLTSLLFITLSSLLCNKPKGDFTTLPFDLPKVDSINNAQCVVRYKSSLYDNNLSLLFNIRIVYFEDGLVDWMTKETSAMDTIITNNLNTSFSSQGISFILKESTVDMNSEGINEFLNHYKDYEKVGFITIIVYKGRDGASFNGIASGVPGIVMGVVEDKIGTSTVPHELGHLLSLPHLFERDDTDGKNVYSGDKICDTGSFNLMDNITKDCGYIGKAKYSKEDLEIIIPNYMTYNAEPIDCRDRFTPVQMLSIRWHIENYPPLYEALVY